MRNPHSIIRNIVGRLHVGSTHREVVEYAVSRLRKGAWDAMAPVARVAFIRDCIAAHEANRGLYEDVMGPRYTELADIEADIGRTLGNFGRNA
jgi:hypothetical protein